MFSLVFRRRFAMAHRLISGASEKCRVPHGHNETVAATLIAAEPARLDGSANMVEPFERAKKQWHRWIDSAVDHAFQLSDRDPLLAYFLAEEPEMAPRLLVCPGDPTTELLAACFKAKLDAFLAAEGGRLRCVEIAIEETPTNMVVFAGDPALVLPARAEGGPAPWWRRADMTINDLAAGPRVARPAAQGGA